MDSVELGITSITFGDEKEGGGGQCGVAAANGLGVWLGIRVCIDGRHLGLLQRARKRRVLERVAVWSSKQSAEVAPLPRLRVGEAAEPHRAHTCGPRGAHLATELVDTLAPAVRDKDVHL